MGSFAECRGEAFAELARLQKLRVLSLVDCSCVTDFTLSCLSAVTSLEELTLDLCDKITDTGVWWIRTSQCD